MAAVEGAPAAGQQAEQFQGHRLPPLIPRRPEAVQALAGQRRAALVLGRERRHEPEEHGGYRRAPVVADLPEPGPARFQELAGLRGSLRCRPTASPRIASHSASHHGSPASLESS